MKKAKISSTWRNVPIGDLVCEIKSWNPLRAGRDEEFTYIDIGAVDQERKEIAVTKSILCCGAPSRARQILANGDILISTVRPNLNAVAVVPAEYDGAIGSTGFCVLRAQHHLVDLSFLFQWVKSSEFISDMVKKATGASYPAVSDRIILESEIPLPPLPEQRRIAQILDKAEALRAKRRAALAKLDTLAQSIFLEMFGDPATNPKGWSVRKISEISTVVTGNTPSRTNPEYYGGSIEWIKSDNINTAEYTLTKSQEFLSEEGKSVARLAPPGSILVTCIAGSPDCIGNVGIADREVAFNQQINAMILNSESLYFVFVQLLVGKQLIQAASTGGMKGMVSKSRFEQVQLISPPLPLQQAFARRVEAIETLKAAHRASLAKLDALFASLQHRAFRGEL